MASRKRRSSRKFEWEAVPDDDHSDLPLPKIRIKHTHLNIDDTGSSSRTSFIPAPSSPTKKGTALGQDLYDSSTWRDEHKSGLCDETGTMDADEELDPAYIHHLDVNEPGPPRRK